MDKKDNDISNYSVDIKLYIKSINKSESLIKRNRVINITKISLSGITFITSIPLNLIFFYEISIIIFEQNIIDTVIKIIKQDKKDDNTYEYETMFCGLTKRDKLLIKTYGIFQK